MILDEPKRKEFEEITRRLMRFLCDNCHPYVMVIVTPTNAELSEGVCSTGQILDYVKD